MSTALTASAAVELVIAALFVFAFVRRPADREYGLAAMLCVAAFEHTMGTLLEGHAAGPESALAADRVAWLGLLAFLPLAVHYALLVAGKRPILRSLFAPYAIAMGFVTVNLWGLVHPGPAGRGALGQLEVGASAATVAAAATVLVLMARAYLAGRREGLAVVIGTTVLLATTINDAGASLGWLRTGHLMDAGLVSFVVAMATTPSARYATAARELDTRSKELRTRTRELRKSYEQLRAAQEELAKKEQLAVVGELAAVIAHEVRNPLAIISNAVAGLRKQTISREDHETLLHILDEEANRLNRLVSDLLRYARPVNVQRQHMSLSDLLERTLGLAHADREGIKIELKVECHEGRIWGDGNLLRQVFDNLVDNGIQAMGTAGTLTVRLRAATEEGIDGIAVDIVDTGEGMDTQVRSRARDPFFTTRPSGTGLGLAIVDRIVDAHGGIFKIDSRAGEGTTVTVFLPHGSPSEPPAPRARAVKSAPPQDPPKSIPPAAAVG